MDDELLALCIWNGLGGRALELDGRSRPPHVDAFVKGLSPWSRNLLARTCEARPTKADLVRILKVAPAGTDLAQWYPQALAITEECAKLCAQWSGGVPTQLEEWTTPVNFA